MWTRSSGRWISASRASGTMTIEIMMKRFLPFLLFFPLGLHAQTPVASHIEDVPAVTVAPGVILKELTGRTATGSDRSEKNSVAFFTLTPVAPARELQQDRRGIILRPQRHGEVWTGDHAQAVRAGSFILVPPGVVRSVRTSKDEPMEFYAVTSPAWSKEDDVLTNAPTGAPK